MAEVSEVGSTSAPELLAAGRRHLAVKDYTLASEYLSKACEALTTEHGDNADQCAEAFLWYGKSLLGLSREERGVLGNGMPAEAEDDEDVEEDTNDDAEPESSDATAPVTNGDVEKIEAESTTKDDEPVKIAEADQAGKSNGVVADESVVEDEEDDFDNEDVDNLQLAWETLELARSILRKRLDSSGDDTIKAQLAEVHMSLGEVAIESETFDKAVHDMQMCLELQKELYGPDDRRIAETHYQIGTANSLASNFDDAITHFKNAINTLETRIKKLETSAPAKDDAAVKKHSEADSSQDEIKEIKQLLPEIQEKIQDMMDYKAETIRRLRATLLPSNGDGASSSSSAAFTNGSGPSSSSSQAKPAASDISHLIKRKRKSSETDTSEAKAAKKADT